MCRQLPLRAGSGGPSLCLRETLERLVEAAYSSSYAAGSAAHAKRPHRELSARYLWRGQCNQKRGEMKRNYRAALSKVLIHEGGWADHPRDPGGATMKGVTLRTYQRFFGAAKTKDDLRNITDDELEQIYRQGYWDKCRCDDLPRGLDYVVFDAAVNSGPARSAKWLQAAVGVTQDGSIGPRTLEKIGSHDPVDTIQDCCDRRLRFLQSLDNWSVFGGGWGRRVAAVRSDAVAMAGGFDLMQAAAPTVQFKTVKKGSSGEWVRKLQSALGLHVDGKFGPVTETALKAWQANNGLEADGIAGRNTYRALGLII
jgi:lysozyme family protein